MEQPRPRRIRERLRVVAARGHDLGGAKPSRVCALRIVSRERGDARREVLGTLVDSASL